MKRARPGRARLAIIGCMTVVLKYALLTYAAIAYGVLLGDNWHWYAMAIMLAAIRSHYVRSPERARVPHVATMRMGGSRSAVRGR